MQLLIDIALSPATGVFNVASGEGVENGQIADLLTRDMGFAVTVQDGAPVWDFKRIDVSKVAVQFGFAPTPFATYFPAFLQKYREKNDIR